MAHSLYRKYRPQTFTDVVGQEHIEQTLKNAVESDNVSHAYLFCGPRGTGKTTTARLLAKALLCQDAPTAHPDGTCEQCREIADGVHPDVYELDAASRTGVENVREEIIGRVQFAPTRGAYKVYIIDEVHMLSTAAFNALLKTLEEPPSHVVFVLCTTDPHKVPATILSRCQRFDFHRLSAEEIVQRLEYICNGEGFTFEQEALDLIAQRSQGGMRDAITALEQIAVFGEGKVTHDFAESMLGEVDDVQLHTIATLIATRDVAGCFRWVASFVENGTDIAQFARDLTAYMRDLYVISLTGGNAEVVLADDKRRAGLVAQAATFGGADRLAHILLLLGDLTTDLRTAANARLSLEIALTRMAHPVSDLTLESLAERIEALENGGLALAFAGGRAPAVQVAPSAEIPDSVASRPEAQQHDGAAIPPQVEQKATTVSENVPADSAPREQEDTVSHEQESTAPGEQESTAPSGQGSALGILDDAATVQRLWSVVVKEIKAKKRGLGAMFGGAKPHRNAEGDGLLIELPSDASFAKTSLEKPESLTYVQELIKTTFGVPLTLSYRLGATPAQVVVPTSTASFADTSGASVPPTSKPATEPATLPIIAPEPEPASIAEPPTEVESVPYEDLESGGPIRLADDRDPEKSVGENPFEAILASSFGNGIVFEEVPSDGEDA